jgi:hypothetical protein
VIESAAKMSDLGIGKQREQAAQQPNRRANFTAIKGLLWRRAVEAAKKLIRAINKMYFQFVALLWYLFSNWEWTGYWAA